MGPRLLPVNTLHEGFQRVPHTLLSGVSATEFCPVRKTPILASTAVRACHFTPFFGLERPRDAPVVDAVPKENARRYRDCPDRTIVSIGTASSLVRLGTTQREEKMPLLLLKV